MTRVVLFHQAEQDLLRAARYLERSTPGAGDRLLNEVGAALKRLAATPHMAPQIADGVRKLVLRQFPYSIYYRVTDGQIVVRAVLHQRRRLRT